MMFRSLTIAGVLVGILLVAGCADFEGIGAGDLPETPDPIADGGGNETPDNRSGDDVGETRDTEVSSPHDTEVSLPRDTDVSSPRDTSVGMEDTETVPDTAVDSASGADTPHDSGTVGEDTAEDVPVETDAPPEDTCADSPYLGTWSGNASGTLHIGDNSWDVEAQLTLWVACIGEQLSLSGVVERSDVGLSAPLAGTIDPATGFIAASYGSTFWIQVNDDWVEVSVSGDLNGVLEETGDGAGQFIYTSGTQYGAGTADGMWWATRP